MTELDMNPATLPADARALYEQMAQRRKAHGEGFGGPYLALLNHPELFGRYIIVSPAVVADAGFYDDSGWSDEAQPPSDVVVSLSAGEQEAELSAA